MDTTTPTPASRTELLRRARERGISGHTSMSKQQLVTALQVEQPQPDAAELESGAKRADGRREVGSRVDAFTALAAARARGEMVLIPRMLTGNDRRMHVRETVREDHETRIAGHNVEARQKFDKLAGSLFSFFRGTSLLFYRDLAGEDARMPTVLALGDVHPSNFGVMPSSDNVPIFGVNDFDEAYYAPFTWDLKRGAVGFLLAAETKGEHGSKKQRAIAERFVRGYIGGIASYAADGTESGEQLRMDNAPALIADLIERALARSRAEWLAGDYLDDARRGFRATDRLIPISSRREEFQGLIDRYVTDDQLAVPERAGRMRVKDVAERKGAGTASLGLSRYYVLVEGPQADGTDDLLLEIKQARQSALSGLVPPTDYVVDGKADRIRHAQRVHLVDGDIFYGSLDFEGMSFMVRERAPYRDGISLGSLSTGDWKDYAEICGRVLAHTHAMSDDTGNIDYDIEPAILDAIGGHDLFVDDMLRFAEEAAARVRIDHWHFVRDHALGAFRSVDVVYR
ncbi:Uncharacterized conserved protein, DUF2252 family [Modestobacter sp. DSM 44400]|uniref:DUF2252 domain-containing protein n=1 Tax=Modestobacter sp. DSM 44400 TaxID=1550230 RepID=UPI000899BD6F|nr:DUF2252 family protein [Modestobacter sp. DSM 44400]SDX79048.1 Uncharacterized conserved protein, DUF2252 family [Modestobacter sp. DSM 44400]